MPEEFNDDDIEFGMGIEPELLDETCLSLAQLLDVVQEAIRRLPDGMSPHDVPVLVMGRVENEETEHFHLVDLMFDVDEKTGEHEALLVSDQSGEMPDILDELKAT